MNVYYDQVNLTTTNQASLASYLKFLFMLLKFPEQYKLLYLILNKNAFLSKDYHPFITEALKIDKTLYISMCPCYDLGIK